MKRFLLAILIVILSSCRNKPVDETLQYQRQIDSLSTEMSVREAEISRKDITIDSLKAIISVRETECASHERKLKQYEQLVKDYHAVVYAIVGEDGLYNYEVIDPD